MVERIRKRYCFRHGQNFRDGFIDCIYVWMFPSHCCPLKNNVTMNKFLCSDIYCCTVDTWARSMVTISQSIQLPCLPTTLTSFRLINNKPVITKEFFIRLKSNDPSNERSHDNKSSKSRSLHPLFQFHPI